jgi:hypothetical protein
MCSGSLIYLLDLWGATEEVTGGEEPRRRLREDKSTADFLLDFHKVQKESGGEQVNTPLP